jgi:hypothetical protein
MQEENTDINILLHRPVGIGDVITVQKDGVLLLNGKVQESTRMELM